MIIMIGRIYIIKSKQTDKVYVGSTFYTLKIRFSKHKSDKNCTSVEILKYNDAEIELLECYECEDEEQLKNREGEYQREYNCVNKRIEGRTPKEYYQDNKEKLKEYQKEYHKKNKKVILEQKKQYYDENKEKIGQYQKEYHEKNKKVILEKKKEKFTCPCGGRYTYSHKARHLKSKKHLNYFKD